MKYRARPKEGSTMRAARCATVDWNWTEFLFDKHVMAMSPRTLGLYVRLLGSASIAEDPGFLLGDEATMKRICGASDDEWRECGREVLARFRAVDGGYLHVRVRRDHEEQTRRVDRIRQQKSDAGKLGNQVLAAQRNQSQRDRTCDADASAAGTPPALLTPSSPHPPHTHPEHSCSSEIANQRRSHTEPREAPAAIGDITEELMHRLADEHGMTPEQAADIRRKTLSRNPRNPAGLFKFLIAQEVPWPRRPDYKQPGPGEMPGFQLDPEWRLSGSTTDA